jgi:hypothetical protein
MHFTEHYTETDKIMEEEKTGKHGGEGGTRTLDLGIMSATL